MKTQLILEELQGLFAGLLDEKIDALAEKVVKAPRVFVCGAGRSGLGLKMFAMRLAQMGKISFVVGETVTPAIGKGDLLIVASASGKTAGVCQNAKAAKAAGAEVWVITATMDGDLARENPCIYLAAQNKDAKNISSHQPMGSLFEQALVILLDGCVLACMEKMQETAETMRSRHANLE
ncbi:MAG: SIS domain-containing protein [Clostridiales bacterium]|nr:SIS domain-containing protein [Clostridiales bacterium]